MGCDSNIREDKSLPNQPYLQLNSKYKIPQYGFGVYQIQGDEATEKACLSAFEIGIRHIDTAHAYENERGRFSYSKNLEYQEVNFLSLRNYGFPTMEKELLPKPLTKCSKD